MARLFAALPAFSAFDNGPMWNRLGDSLDFQAQALTLRAERQRVIAGNIANADTPGFKARDFDFAKALQAATGQGAAGDGIAQGVMGSGTGLQPTLRYALPDQTQLDDNTVDMDRERGEFASNAVKYESTLRFITGNVRTMLDALKSPNQG